MTAKTAKSISIRILGGVTMVLAISCGFKPQTVVFSADVDNLAKAELAKAVEAYNAQTKKFIVTMVDKDAPKIDLTLGPYVEGGIAWRSVGWRLWTRLETLAGIEGKLNRSLIRPLREGSMTAENLTALLADIRKQGLTPIVLPKTPAAYALALERYVGHVAGGETYARWKTDKWIGEATNLQTAVDDVVRGRAVFIMASDQMGTWLGRSSDNHPEGFNLPGSQSIGSGWAIGRGDNFTIAAKPKSKNAVIDFLTYLTSKGIAQNFAKTLSGSFYYWTEAPAKGQYPTVAGPTEFLDPEKQ